MIEFLRELGFRGNESEILLSAIAVCVAYGVVLYWARGLFLARHGIGHSLRVLFEDYFAPIYLIGCGCLFLSFPQSRTTQSHIMFAIGFFFLLAGLYFAFRPKRAKRKRYIPKRIRDAVIARDLKGMPFDPAIHHIDHVWPFSRGGSQTVENLRVYSKKKNLQKGSKRPRMRDMWFQTRERL